MARLGFTAMSLTWACMAGIWIQIDSVKLAAAMIVFAVVAALLAIAWAPRGFREKP